MSKDKNIKTAQGQPDGYTLLAPVPRNYLKKRDKIRMRNGKVLTVKFTEFSEVYVTESVFPVSKKDIETILE